jgi:hypothetical protein
MAVSIVPNSASVSITGPPGVNPPLVNPTNVQFRSRTIQASGRVDFTLLPADPVTGWLVGWIQAQWIETNWGYFRGRLNNDGSVFHQRARPPARLGQSCRDTVGPVGDIFYSTSAGLRASPTAGGPSPQTVSVVFRDTPGETYPISVTNSLTGQPNFLREVQLEFHFATVFVVRDPVGTFHQLNHFYWNMHWQYRFTLTAFPPGPGSLTPTPVMAGNGGNVGRIFSGAATDRRFAGVLTSAQTNSCNQVASNASASPNVRESSIWNDFDVRR